jgi:basic membrane protein A and related proteins
LDEGEGIVKRSKSLALVVAAVLVIALVAGCAATPTPSTSGSGGTTAKPKIKTAMVTDVGGLGDKSFNDLSYAGLQKAKSELGVDVKVLESSQIADYETNLSQLANAGYNPIFAVGFLMTDTVSKLSTAFPNTNFGGVDEFFDPVPKNVVGLNFKEQEGCYLAGVVAAMATTDKSVDPRINDQKVVGFVGGLDVPLIKKFEAGFKAGVKSVDPSIKVVSLYAGSFADQAKGKELGLSEINQGADVIFAAAGATGEGTFKACQESKKALFIGVDADQFNTIKNSGDTILTSVVKRVDTAVFDTVKQAVDGKFPGGTIAVFGLKEGGMDLAPFHDFEAKVPQKIKDAVAKAKADIIAGTIVVPDKL